MLLLVGLGNPGPRYAHNRHNIGYMALDAVVRRYGLGPWRARFQGRAAEGRVGETKVLALKPETYMNESGRAVGEAARFYKLSAEDVVVFHDELDLRPGKVKVKRGGGHAGHNGLRSLHAHIGPDYRRVRLGIGHPGHKDLVETYVLKDFSKDEARTADKLVEAVAEELPRLLAGDDGGFMSRVAYRVSPPKPKSPPPAKEPAKPETRGDEAAESGDEDGGKNAAGPPEPEGAG